MTKKYLDSIPYFNLPENIMIQVIPPFGGAATRFRLKKKDSDKIISVYFDVNDSLGYMGQPYWEAYPIEDEVSRYLNTQDEFDKMITDCIAELETNK